MFNNLYLAKINEVSPYSFEYLGGVNTCISCYNSYVTLVYKTNDKYIDIFNKDRDLHSKDYIAGVKKYEIEEIMPFTKAISRSLTRKR